MSVMGIPITGLQRALERLNYNEQTIRFWSLTYMLLYLGFGYVDFLSAPISHQIFWMIRGLVLPFFLLAMLSTYVEVIARYRLFINAVMVFMSPFSIIIMIAVSDPAEWSTYIYFSGIVLTAFPIGFILMNARYAVVIALLLAIFYYLIVGLGLNYYHGDVQFFIITSFFVVSTLIAIILSTYLLEYNQKKIVSQKQEVEGLVEMKNTLINILAHDLRAPCNSIVGFSDLYIRDCENFEATQTKFFMENINSSAHNLLALLHNLLEWSRVQTDTCSFNPVVISLDELITTNIKMTKEAMELKRISLRQTKSDSGLQIVADKNMIDTVFRNLLSNAIKFTGEGGQIDLKYWSTGNLACVAIIDNGVGIETSKIETLFEITNSKSTKGTNNEPGSGLGLVLCREFIAKNEGHIWVKSNKGEGTAFTFTLPLQQAS